MLKLISILFSTFCLVSGMSPLDPMNLYRMSLKMMNSINLTLSEMSCRDAYQNILSNPDMKDTLVQMFVSSGKSVQDLGNYQLCDRNRDYLKYVLVTVNSSNSTYNE